VKLVFFCGDSLARIKAFPADARQDAGFQIYKLQREELPDDWKPMKTIGKGVKELRMNAISGHYRVIYLTSLANAIHVLHAFAKRTRKTRKSEIGLARKRLKIWINNMVEKFENVFDAITSSPGEALNMKLRASLILEIRSKIEAGGWTQVETAKQLGISQPRVSDLLSGKLSKFSLDALVNMLAALGGVIKLKVA